MFICGVILLLECVKPLREVCAYSRGVIIGERRVVQMELMLLVVGEAREFLQVGGMVSAHKRCSSSGHSVVSHLLITFGLLTGWLAPANRPIGCIGKLDAMLLISA